MAWDDYKQLYPSVPVLEQMETTVFQYLPPLIPVPKKAGKWESRYEQICRSTKALWHAQSQITTPLRLISSSQMLAMNDQVLPHLVDEYVMLYTYLHNIRNCCAALKIQEMAQVIKDYVQRLPKNNQIADLLVSDLKTMRTLFEFDIPTYINQYKERVK